MDWITYYWGVVFTSLFGLVLPWWFWGVAGLLGAGAVWFLLPSAVSIVGITLKFDRVRDLLAWVALAAGLSVSSMSWGIERGTEVCNARWERERAAEVLRLASGFKAEAQVEAQRANNAEDYNKFLEGELQNVIATKHPESPDLCPPDSIVVPRATVDRMRNWTTRRPRSPDH